MLSGMKRQVKIIGAGLAGSEAALQLADRGVRVTLVEMRPAVQTPVHRGGDCAELVCSNSFKSMKGDSAAGMLKSELDELRSHLMLAARRAAVPAGGALAVDRERFSADVTSLIDASPHIIREVREARDVSEEAQGCDALVLATGPLTSDALAGSISELVGSSALAFFDAAAPIVTADSLDRSRMFSQSRYEEGSGDYLNAPLSRKEYEVLIDALLEADRVILRDFETKDLFQACQPIEEVARGQRRAALRRPQAGRPHRPRNGSASLGRRTAARGGRARPVLQPRGFPDQPDLPRAATGVPHDPRPRERRVRALRRHAPQHLPRRPAPSRRIA